MHTNACVESSGYVLIHPTAVTQCERHERPLRRADGHLAQREQHRLAHGRLANANLAQPGYYMLFVRRRLTGVPVRRVDGCISAR